MSRPFSPSMERPLRRHRRAVVPLAATVGPATGSEPPLRTHSLDVSESGVLLACVGISGTVRVSLQLPDGQGRVSALGRVTRTEPGRTAIEFTQISPFEATQLRRLVPHGQRTALSA